MGEIGFPRCEFLHELRWWEVCSIIRGYDCRCHNLWGAVRWATFHFMSAQMGSDEMKKHKIFDPKDLIKFPWEKKKASPITEAEAKQLMKEIDGRRI